MTDEAPAADLARRDEMLQLLYWIEGEGFVAAATPAALARFLTWELGVVDEVLALLMRRGEITVDEHGVHRLSEEGRREAARRFADEFAPLINQGHGECNDPDCDCHTDPAAAAECHAARRPVSG